MNNKDMILKLYFLDKYTANQIALELKVSNAYVTQILKNDSRYNDERELRKMKNKENHVIKTKKYIYEKRKENSIVEAQMLQQHIQATRELSAGKTIIGNRAFRKWNASAYKYNSNRKCYEFDRKLTRCYGIPKYIK